MHAERTKLHQTPNTIQYVGIHTAKTGEHYPVHRDKYWELMYLRAGHITCQQGEENYQLHPGMIILHPPDVPHADFATTAYTTYYLWIDAPRQTAWPRLCYDDGQQSLERLCRAVVEEWRGQGAERDRMLALLTEQLEVALRRASGEADRTATECAVAAAEQILEAGYQEALTVGEIAQRVGVSKSSLHAYFAQLRGQTPMEALQTVRLRHALALLHHSAYPLERVAEMCGYHSASHLSRHVKAATGDSPGRLRGLGAKGVGPASVLRTE